MNKKKVKKKKQKMFSWMNPDLEVRDTKKCGKGVFAKKDIKKGETLAIFGGYIMTIEEERNLPKKFRDSGLQIDENFVISSKDHFESTDFFNHNCEPNAGFKGQNFLVSMNKIKKNEEITFDYAMCLFSKIKKNSYSFDCFCNSKNCRLKITSEDWKIKKLQKKYDDFFIKFLQDKIKH